MPILLTFPGDADHPSHSPFCVKAMCLLDMARAIWEPKTVTNPAKMPLSRLPVLKLEDRLIPDSHHIQSWLEAQGTDFYCGLDNAARARGHMLIRMVEENLRLGLVYDRWLNDECWPIVREKFFADLPQTLRGGIAALARRKCRRDLIAHGIARFSPADRLDRLAKDIDALTCVLGGKPFLLGARPTAPDAATVPVLDMIRTLPVDTGLRRLVRENDVLMDYVARGRAAMYPGEVDTATARLAA